MNANKVPIIANIPLIKGTRKLSLGVFTIKIVITAPLILVNPLIIVMNFIFSKP
ncbi:hypothetical protein TUM17570_15210 [Enterobacter cloacae]|nr:hypothetical protein TUM17570_15210 [Enterobacter cloacae]